MTDNDISFWAQSISISLGISIYMTSGEEEIVRVLKNNPFFKLISNVNLKKFANKYTNICVKKVSYFIEGPFSTYFMIICLDENFNKNLVIGPFINKVVSKDEILEVTSLLNFDYSLVEEIVKYYNTVPIVENLKLISLINLFLEKYFNTNGPFPFIFIQKNNLSENNFDFNINLDNISFSSIENQYKMENEFLNYVSAGNFSSACITFKNLILDAEVNFKLDSYFYSSSGFFMLNSMLKKSVESSGVHPTYLDSVFRRYNLIISSNKNLNKNMALKMIKDYCNLVTKYSLNYINPLLRKIIAYINYNYSSELTVSGISNHFGITSNYLYCLFKKEMGISAIEFINKTRIDEASKLIRETDMQIQNVAESVGLNDTSYFARLFKKYMGITPSRYKKNFNL
ncbi:AraC family transcriptional regulator [Romboutsia ilealis]|uniref:Helix-turn-helix transcriptional regulator n=1 Tax=Romboutsia faecis TaxID=2764597 RepID=A0ABR7JPM2_9FIRM|nr:AraC family transcriptional regulator [Romboutsia faecis]MBC5996881.1 helix-turn-helix transcriptional regulator [Romboutsia faecis]MRN24615.1 AraC family transcriptional regulator [Romboutsia ilealis]